MRNGMRWAAILAGGAGWILLAGPGAAPAPADSQSGTNLETPPGWKARYDEAGAEDRGHVVMRPGWHINPGPAGIFWDPGRFATDGYSISSTIFLFPPPEDRGPRDIDAPYGIIAGGAGLDGATPEYVAFLVRNDGSYRVLHRSGDEVHDIVPWTSHEAVARWTEEAGGTARNDFLVNATAEEVQWFLNDQRLGTFPRENMELRGVVGLRVGDELSIHVRELAIGAAREDPQGRSAGTVGRDGRAVGGR